MRKHGRPRRYGTIQSRWIGAMSEDCRMWFPAGARRKAARNGSSAIKGIEQRGGRGEKGDEKGDSKGDKDNPDFFRSANSFQKWISLGGQNDNLEEIWNSLLFFSPPSPPQPRHPCPCTQVTPQLKPPLLFLSNFQGSGSNTCDFTCSSV